jgi:hypothetical protein
MTVNEGLTGNVKSFAEPFDDAVGRGVSSLACPLVREFDVAHSIWTSNSCYACFAPAMLVNYHSSNPEYGYRWNGSAKVDYAILLTGKQPEF